MIQSVAGIVLRNLKAIRRVGRVQDDEIKDWLDELVRKLGPLDPERLQAAFDSARDTHSSEQRFGEVSIDDLVLTYVRLPSDTTPPPQDESCDTGCDNGEVDMVDRDGYVYLVPCSCSAGEHLRRTRGLFQVREGPDAGRPLRNADELRRLGWRLFSEVSRESPPDPEKVRALAKRIRAGIIPGAGAAPPESRGGS